MDTTVLVAIVGAGCALAGAIGGAFLGRLTNRDTLISSQAQSYYDNLRKDVESLRARVATLEGQAVARDAELAACRDEAYRLEREKAALVFSAATMTIELGERSARVVELEAALNEERRRGRIIASELAQWRQDAHGGVDVVPPPEEME